MSQIRQQKQRKRSRFWKLYLKAKFSGSLGAYTIVVKKVLAVGEFWLNQPDVAIVEDMMGDLWRIPETKLRGLVSRHDIEKGMISRIKINKCEEISEVFVRNG